VAVGARKFLIAFNVNLESGDLAAARAIAAAVRESGGGLACVKALGLPLESEGIVQVSMNLTDFETTPIVAAFDAVKAEADRRGIPIRGSELVGLAPAAALDARIADHVRLRGFNSGMILEARLAATLNW
jgi:glutamate formiminotransferase